MSKKHDAIFDDVLKDIEAPAPQRDRAGARFLKRSNTMAEQASGQRQEKVLRLVDPESCVMWAGHNRAYDALTEDNCRDLIDGLLSQGQQEFPAIVRRLRGGQGGEGPEFEVICGARRHFAVSWLRANNYPKFQYLVEERELTDEEAFRLADIENRDREDISDYERALDYARAVKEYYGGKQNVMAERLQVSPAWLSRYLQLARLDSRIIAAFPSLRDVKELHARTLKPLLAEEESRLRVLYEAAKIADGRAAGEAIPVARVMSRLKAAATPPRQRDVAETVYRSGPGAAGVQLRRKGNRLSLEFARDIPDADLRAAVERLLKDRASGQA
ncbi:ParB/RepB/Spo0J family partition protein [Pseudooceanicola sp. C21-150M6]|uniref:ParB/RepB/Spo0J family partition protein n=1 Tax=Pseudooceanicola sp. C21-150M6 TaxID=3434355 RepID=UPI003D7F2DF6